MRILVSGSRIFDEEPLLFSVLDDLHAIDAEYGPVTIIHGGARGADNIAARWAYNNKQKTEVYYPDWNKYGKAAGILRNKDMLDTGVDVVVAFPRGAARGTKHMIKIAEEAGVRTIVK
jgi:YspA, cpYpsA-related SLOG family